MGLQFKNNQLLLKDGLLTFGDTCCCDDNPDNPDTPCARPSGVHVLPLTQQVLVTEWGPYIISGLRVDDWTDSTDMTDDTDLSAHICACNQASWHASYTSNMTSTGEERYDGVFRTTRGVYTRYSSALQGNIILLRNDEDVADVSNVIPGLTVLSTSMNAAALRQAYYYQLTTGSSYSGAPSTFQLRLTIRKAFNSTTNLVTFSTSTVEHKRYTSAAAPTAYTHSSAFTPRAGITIDVARYQGGDDYEIPLTFALNSSYAVVTCTAPASCLMNATTDVLTVELTPKAGGGFTFGLVGGTFPIELSRARVTLSCNSYNSLTMTGTLSLVYACGDYCDGCQNYPAASAGSGSLNIPLTVTTVDGVCTLTTPEAYKQYIDVTATLSGHSAPRAGALLWDVTVPSVVEGDTATTISSGGSVGIFDLLSGGHTLTSGPDPECTTLMTESILQNGSGTGTLIPTGGAGCDFPTPYLYQHLDGSGTKVAGSLGWTSFQYDCTGLTEGAGHPSNYCAEFSRTTSSMYSTPPYKRDINECVNSYTDDHVNSYYINSDINHLLYTVSVATTTAYVPNVGGGEKTWPSMYGSWEYSHDYTDNSCDGPSESESGYGYAQVSYADPTEEDMGVAFYNFSTRAEFDAFVDPWLAGNYGFKQTTNNTSRIQDGCTATLTMKRYLAE